MQCPIKNPSNYDLTNLEPHVHGMYDHFASKYGFQEPPTMVFDSDQNNQGEVLGKTAYYDPQSFEIHVFVDGRHSKDILRSIAHELIHHKQNLEGRLDVGGYSGPGYYLENDKLKEVEHEAMLEGNATMREYEDTVKYTETKNMSLKEWKNNELNQLLMKKFGILKEEKKNMVKDPKTGKMVPDYAIDGKGPNDLAEDAELEEVSSNAQHTDRRQDGEDETREQGRLHEEELEEGSCGSHKRDDNTEGNKAKKDLEEAGEIRKPGGLEYHYGSGQQDIMKKSVKNPTSPTKNRFKKALDAAAKQRGEMNEDDLEERARGRRRTAELDPARDDERTRPMEESNQYKSLKESLKNIAKAKKIFLNNKRIK